MSVHTRRNSLGNTRQSHKVVGEENPRGRVLQRGPEQETNKDEDREQKRSKACPAMSTEMDS